MKCGTYAGYKVHQKTKEPTCDACKAAAAAYNKQWRAAHPGKTAGYNKAYKQAHPERVEAAYQAIKAKTAPEVAARSAARKAAAKAREDAKAAARIERLERLEANRRSHQAKKEAWEAVQAERAHKKAVEEEAKTARALSREAAYWDRLSKSVDKRDTAAMRRELRELNRKPPKPPRAPAQHGTLAKYSSCTIDSGRACQPCRDAVAAYQRQYAKNNKEKVKSWNRASHNRRKRNVESRAYLRKQVLDKWGTDCHICGEPIDLNAPRQCGELGWERGLHLDHVVPLSSGGPDVLENVKPSHARCNIDKGTTLLS